MPSLIDLRRRVRSVKNTKQITSAMKMVSAAKLRRAQDAVLSARPYSTLLADMIASIVSRAGDNEALLSNPLLEAREEKRVLAVVVSAEKGLCGAFNSNVFRATREFLEARPGAEVELELVGKKGADYYAKRKTPIAGSHRDVLTKRVDIAFARDLAQRATKRFLDGEIDAVYLLYNRFKGAMAQTVATEKLLPISADVAAEEESGGPNLDYLIEPDAESVFAMLLPRFVETRAYQAMLESAAAEHASRMTAMDAATRNAGEMIDQLTLHLNRVRQASITNEIIEIVGGASALES